MKNNRLHLLDTVRGITVLSMVLYHTLWDVVYIYGVSRLPTKVVFICRLFLAFSVDVFVLNGLFSL
ncbi:MAG: DUF1624 domain-containing protein [Ruminococcaceae bacterium]|nr:DUF1624 domain-containing protein [Oscillospiraceae bacterium]